MVILHTIKKIICIYLLFLATINISCSWNDLYSCVACCATSRSNSTAEFPAQMTEVSSANFNSPSATIESNSATQLSMTVTRNPNSPIEHNSPILPAPLILPTNQKRGSLSAPIVPNAHLDHGNVAQKDSSASTSHAELSTSHVPALPGELVQTVQGSNSASRRSSLLNTFFNFQEESHAGVAAPIGPKGTPHEALLQTQESGPIPVFDLFTPLPNAFLETQDALPSHTSSNSRSQSHSQNVYCSCRLDHFPADNM